MLGVALLRESQSKFLRTYSGVVEGWEGVGKVILMLEDTVFLWEISLKLELKTEDKIKTIAVGDNYNDLDMLKSCDIPCLVFNDQFIQEQINIDNLIFSNKPSPEGWADVIKTALAKLEY